MTPGNRSSMNASSLHKIAWCFWSWKTQAIHGGKHAYTEVYQTPRLGRQPSWSVDLAAQPAALRWQASEVVGQAQACPQAEACQSPAAGGRALAQQVPSRPADIPPPASRAPAPAASRAPRLTPRQMTPQH